MHVKEKRGFKALGQSVELFHLCSFRLLVEQIQYLALV